MKKAKFSYHDIKKGKTYFGRRVSSIWPGVNPLASRMDEVTEINYMDKSIGYPSYCSAKSFAAWVRQQLEKEGKR